MKSERPRCVLVLDDEEDSRELVKLVLEPMGYRVYDAGNGEEGLAILEKESVGVALVDLLMPGMSGEEFLRLVGRLPEEKRPVCVVNSARRRHEVEKELEDLEVFDVVSKPFELDDLGRLIARAWEEWERRTSR